MQANTTTTSKIDPDNIICTQSDNGCRVRLFFMPQENQQSVKNVVNNLIDTFEKRMSNV